MASPLKIDYKACYLGLSRNHVDLHNAISKYAFGNFWVTNEDSEQELRGVRCAFDDEVDSLGRGVLHFLLVDGDHEAPFRLLLSLGVDPDKPAGNAQQLVRPSHYATLYGRPSCARALAPCRPDLTAVHEGGRTPITIPVSN